MAQKVNIVCQRSDRVGEHEPKHRNNGFSSESLQIPVTELTVVDTGPKTVGTGVSG